MGVSINKSKLKIKRYYFRDDLKEKIPRINYISHNIHPYTAKLIPQIPHYLINKYTKKDALVFDPFCGSGTSLLEAKILGRNAIGIDINPLAKLISGVKTTPLNLNDLVSISENIKNKLWKKNNKNEEVDFPNIDYWFSKKAQNELSRVKFCIENLDEKVEKNIHMFLLLCFSSIIRKSSYADPRIAKIYKSKRVKARIKNGWIPKPIVYFEKALDRNFLRIKSLMDNLDSNNNSVKVFQGDAKETSLILRKKGISKVDFIITSPPYINAQDYFRSYKLELFWLGLATPEDVRNLNKKSIGTERTYKTNQNRLPKSRMPSLDRMLKRVYGVNKNKSYIIYNYFENMRIVLKEFYKVLKRGGYFCLITGNNTICEVQIPTYRILSTIAKDIGLKLIEIGKDTIENRSLPPKRNHKGGIIKEEWITVFQKKI